MRALPLLLLSVLATAPASAQRLGTPRPPTPFDIPVPGGGGLVRPEPTFEALKALPLGLAALELEAVAGADVGPARAALGRAVAEVRARLPASREPRAVLTVLAEATAAVCPAFRDGQVGWLFSDALRAGACDCDILTLTYLTVADAVGLPLSAVFLPGHVLLVWDDRHERIYWETTVPEERPAWFVEAFVPEGAESAYLRPQTREEMVGYLYLIRADSRHARGDLDGAAADYERAVRLTPALPLAFHNRGRARLLAERYEAAAADFAQTLALDPTYADAFYGRGLAHLLLGRPEEALEDFGGALALDGPSADALHGRGLALAMLRRDDEAERSYTEALVADPTLLVVLLDRAALYERQGDADRARRDYLAFLDGAIGTPYEAEVPAAQRRLLGLRRLRA